MPRLSGDFNLKKMNQAAYPFIKPWSVPYFASAEYRWSSYRANAQGESDALIQPHAVYDALGPDAASRQAAYRELFRYELEPGLLDKIRQATNGNYALGSDLFTEQIAAALGRRVTPGKSGRPRKVADPESAGG